MPSRRTELADLPDVNLLFALLHPAHVHHVQALEWFSQTSKFFTTPINESGFIRLTLNRAVTGDAVPLHHALTSLSSIKRDPRAEFLPDDATFTEPQIALDGLVGHRQVADFHLVNLAASHQARLVTFDTRIAGTLVDRDRERVRVLG